MASSLVLWSSCILLLTVSFSQAAFTKKDNEQTEITQKFENIDTNTSEKSMDSSMDKSDVDTTTHYMDTAETKFEDLRHNHDRRFKLANKRNSHPFMG